MKTLEELEVGKWYQDTSWYSKKDYAKFEKVEIRGVWDQLWYSENISNGNYTKRDNFWDFTISTLREVPLEEIQEFLPDGHPDKISVVEKELTELPEKWCIKDIPEVKSYFEKYNHGNYSCSNTAYLHYPRIKRSCYFLTIQSEYIEITLEQFKKWVLKEDSSKIEDKLPTNWCIRGCEELRDFCKNTNISGDYKTYYYFNYTDPKDPYSKKWTWTLNPADRTKISFETFEKHVLSKEFKSVKSEEQTTTISTVDVPSSEIYISGRDPYDHYLSPQEIMDKYYLHEDLSISKLLTKKESFKLNKLPTKSWY